MILTKAQIEEMIESRCDGEFDVFEYLDMLIASHELLRARVEELEMADRKLMETIFAKCRDAGISGRLPRS